jgi:hypothetical protein
MPSWFNRSFSLLALLIWAVLPTHVTAQSATAPTTAATEDNPDLFDRAFDNIGQSRTWQWLESQRNDLSSDVGSIGRNLDDWLAGEGIGERANESFVRLKVNQRIGRMDTYYSNIRLGGRIDLPRTSERWKLIFETETTEQNSLRDQRLNNINASSFTGGFSYELPERNGWRFNHDVGAKSSIPIDPFYRFRTRYDTTLGEDWFFGLSNRLFYYHDDGFGQDTRVFFSREISSQLNFRVETEVNYRHNERLTEFGQSVALFHALGDQETLTYEVGLIGRNRPLKTVDNYYAQMVFRKAVYQDWLVLELVPQLLFEDRYDWKADPRVQLNLEIYFFEIPGN